MIQVILSILLTFPTFWYDRNESTEARHARMLETAQAIAGVAKNRTEAAALIAVAWHESRFSAHVQTGRCNELPKGMQCDGGQARSIFQLHRGACPELWETPVNEHTRIGARCAMRLLRGFRERCASVSGAFGMYAARSCKWKGGVSRETTMRKVLEQWRRHVS